MAEDFGRSTISLGERRRVISCVFLDVSTQVD